MRFLLTLNLRLTVRYIGADSDNSFFLRQYVRPVDRVFIAVAQSTVVLVQHVSSQDLYRSQQVNKPVVGGP